MKFDLQHTAEILQLWLKDHLPKISAETLGWLAAIVIHAATIPTLLALMTGLSDRTPSLDIVLFIAVYVGRPGPAVLTGSGAQRHAQHHHSGCRIHCASGFDGLNTF